MESADGGEVNSGLPFLEKLLSVTDQLRSVEHTEGKYPKAHLRSLLPTIFKSKTFVDDYWEKKVLVLRDLAWMKKVGEVFLGNPEAITRKGVEEFLRKNPLMIDYDHTYFLGEETDDFYWGSWIQEPKIANGY